MKDTNDLHTVDAFQIKKRGRPKSKNALTPAQRKAAQRRRDFENFCTRDAPIADIPLTSLCDFLAKSVTSGLVDRVKLICKELMRRANDNI